MLGQTSHAQVFQAVADPTRRRILDLLIAGERSVSELVDEFSMSQPAVSQHLRVLRQAELVHVHKHGRKRLYHLDARGIKAVFDWTKHYEKFWEQRLQRMGQLLDELPDTDIERESRKKSENNKGSKARG